MGVTDNHREPEGDRERASKSQLEQDPIRLSFVATRQNTVFLSKIVKYALRAEINGCKCAKSRLQFPNVCVGVYLLIYRQLGVHKSVYSRVLQSASYSLMFVWLYIYVYIYNWVYTSLCTHSRVV